MSPSPNPTNDLIELPPWGRDERDVPDLAEKIRRIKERIRLIRDRRGDSTTSGTE